MLLRRWFWPAAGDTAAWIAGSGGFGCSPQCPPWGLVREALRPLYRAQRGRWSQHFDYDAFGNRWVSSSSLALSPLTPQAQAGYNAATNQLTSSLFQYDASGNQTLVSPWRIAYDGENRQVSVTNTGTGAVTTYS